MYYTHNHVWPHTHMCMSILHSTALNMSTAPGEGGREGGREGGKEGRREGGKEGGREGEREGGREGGEKGK